MDNANPHKKRIPTRLTKVNFNNKSYSHGHYKDGTNHITVNSDHDSNHPSPIDPDPLMHVLGVAQHSHNPTALQQASKKLKTLVKQPP